MGGFTQLKATDDHVTVTTNHTARYTWSELLASDVNPNGQSVLFTDSSKPDKGTADFSTAGSFLYTPPQNFLGTDTAAAGNWKPSPITLTNQWQRSGVTISGATASI